MKEILKVVSDADCASLFKEGYNRISLDDDELSQMIRTAKPLGRNLAEDDRRFRQLIVYVTVIVDDKYIMAYKRSGSEKRLHDLWSIGFGGHMDFVADGCESNAIIREIKEELGINTRPEDYYFGGVIYKSDTEVDSVHLGLHFILPLSEDTVIEPSDEGYDLTLYEYEELKDLNLESWSKCVMDSNILERLINV